MRERGSIERRTPKSFRDAMKIELPIVARFHFAFSPRHYNLLLIYGFSYSKVNSTICGQISLPNVPGQFYSRARTQFFLGLPNQEFNSPRNYYFRKARISSSWLDFQLLRQCSVWFFSEFSPEFTNSLPPESTQTSISIRGNFNHSMTVDRSTFILLFYFISFVSTVKSSNLFLAFNMNCFIHFNLFNLFVINISTICTINSRNEFVISRLFVNICTCFFFVSRAIFEYSKRGNISRPEKSGSSLTSGAL